MPPARSVKGLKSCMLARKKEDSGLPVVFQEGPSSYVITAAWLWIACTYIDGAEKESEKLSIDGHEV